MPDGTGHAYPLVTHGSTVVETTVPVVSMKMTVPINRRSIELPTGLFNRGVEGSRVCFARLYVHHIAADDRRRVRPLGLNEAVITIRDSV